MTYPPINCRPETHNSEISSKISYLLTYLTAIGFVLTTQQENRLLFSAKRFWVMHF